MSSRIISVKAAATRLGIPVEEVKKLERRRLLHAAALKDGGEGYSAQEIAKILSGAGLETREAAAKMGIFIRHQSFSLAKKLALVMSGELLCLAFLWGVQVMSPDVASSTATILTPVVINRDALNKDPLNGLKVAETDGSVLSIAAGKALIAKSTLELDGSDGATIVFQGSDVYVGRNTADILTNKTLQAGANTITGLSNANLNGAAGITNENLANSTINLLGGPGISVSAGVVRLGDTVTISSIGGAAGVSSVAGTLNQITTSAATGAITLSLPQDIGLGNSPTFTGLRLQGASNQLIFGASNNGTLSWSPTGPRTLTLPDASDMLLGRATLDTLTNKTIAAASNTISGLTNTNLSGAASITNANLANSSITVNTSGPLGGGGVVSLGGSLTITCPTCAGGGGGTLFTAAASSGTSSPISQSDTLTIAAGTNITTTSNGAGTITIATSATPGFTTVNGLTITNTGANALTIAAGKTLTASNSLTFTGTDGTTFALPAASDTLVGRASTDTLTNKTIAASSNTITGLTATNLTAGDFSSKINSGLYSIDISGNAATATSTISFSGALAGDVTGLQGATTVAKINGNSLGLTTPTAGNLLIGSGTSWITRALSGDATLDGAGALTLKNVGTAGTYGSATSIPVITTDAEGRVSGVASTAIAGLTVSHFASPNISQWTNNSGYITSSSTDTLTNKTISGASNTLTNIPNSALTNAGLTFAGNSGSGAVALGGTLTILGAGINNAVYSGGTITVTGTEADTLASVTGRGATTSTALTLSNASNNITAGTLTATGGTINGTSIGAITPSTGVFTTVNGLTIANNGTNTLNIAAGKTLTASNTLTFTGTDGTSFALPSASDTLVGRTSTDALTNKTVNGLTFTANAVGFSIAGGTTSKTLTLNNTLTLAGVDSSALTFQGTDTYVGRATTDTLTNKTLTAPAINGTVTTTGLTLPVYTAAGNITGSGSPTISSFGAINGLTLTAASDGLTISGGTTSRTVTVTGADITIGSTIKPTSAGTLAVQSNGANTLSFDTGGAAALNIGTTNANGLSIGQSGVTTSIAGTADANNLKIGSGTTITKHLSGTATFNAASIPLGSCANIGTVTVAGAAVGDSVTAAPTPVSGGIETVLLIWNAYVSATDTVTIRACSVATIGGQDAGNQTWRADIWQH